DKRHENEVFSIVNLTNEHHAPLVYFYNMKRNTEAASVVIVVDSYRQPFFHCIFQNVCNLIQPVIRQYRTFDYRLAVHQSADIFKLFEHSCERRPLNHAEPLEYITL